MVSLVLLLQWYAELYEHNLSWSSRVGFLNTYVFLCLLGEFTSTWCHHGDSPSRVSFLQGGGQDLTMFNPVKYMIVCNVNPWSFTKGKRRGGVSRSDVTACSQFFLPRMHCVIAMGNEHLCALVSPESNKLLLGWAWVSPTLVRLHCTRVCVCLFACLLACNWTNHLP